MARIVAGPVSFLFPTRIFLFPSVIVTTSLDITLKKNWKKNGWPPWNITNFEGILVINWSFHVLSKEILPGLKIKSFFCFCLKIFVLPSSSENRVLTNDYLTSNPPAHTTHLFLLCMITQPELPFLTLTRLTVSPDPPFHVKFDRPTRPTCPH